jgi:hypothetical protein
MDHSSQSRSTLPGTKRIRLDSWTRQRLFILVVTSIVIRVGTVFRISREIQCSKKAVEVSHESCGSSSFEFRFPPFSTIPSDLSGSCFTY